MRIYSVVMNEVSVSAAQDLIRVSAPATKSILLLRASITQSDSTKSDNVLGKIMRASSDGTGTARTARPYDPGDSAYGGSAVVDLSADTTKSPAEALHEEGFNLLNGYLWIPKDQEIIAAPGAGRLVLRLDVAPSQAVSMSAKMVVAEIG